MRTRSLHVAESVRGGAVFLWLFSPRRPSPRNHLVDQTRENWRATGEWVERPTSSSTTPTDFGAYGASSYNRGERLAENTSNLNQLTVNTQGRHRSQSQPAGTGGAIRFRAPAAATR